MGRCFFILVIFLMFCDSKLELQSVDFKFSYDSFSIQKSLEGKKLDLGTIYSPVDIFFDDSLLFVSSIGQNFNVSVFDTHDDYSKLAHIFKNGAGPSETYSVAKMDFLKDGSVWVHDIMATSMKRFNFSSIMDSVFVEELESAFFMNPILSAVYVNDSIFYTTTQGVFPHSRFYVYSKDGDEMRSHGSYPNFGLEIPPTVEVDVFWAKSMVHPSREKFILAYEYLDLVELFSRDGNLIKRIHGPLQFLPSFDIGERGGTPYMKRVYEKTQHAYKSLAVNEEEIFLLFANGRTNKPGDKEASIHYNHVVVLNWNGDPIRFYELDHAVASITVDWNNKILYGLDRIESEIYAFQF
jgi:hypothetical protein